MKTATKKPTTRVPESGRSTNPQMNRAVRLNSESEFKESLRESISWQWDTYEYYQHLCNKKGLHLSDLKKAIDNEEYYVLPGVASLAFKKSRGLANELNDFSVEGKFQISSSTSGDPSYIYTHQDELKQIHKNYVATFGIKGVSRAIAFSPSIRILESVSKKAAYLGKQSIARMKFALDAAESHYSDLLFTVDVNILKSIFSMTFQSKPTFNKLSQEHFVELLRCSEEKKEILAVGGVVLLFAPYLDRMSEGQFNFHDNIHVVFAGGGYSGRKGSICGDKINKPELARKISAVLGLDEKYLSTNLKDIYGFTENPTTHEGYWNSEINDFMFQPWPDSRVYIVDPETEKPLKQGKGLFKIISPWANCRPCSANVSVIQYDLVRIFGVSANYQVTHFSHISRFQTAGMEGCALKADAIANA
jgi:hypothetical protein